MLETTPDHIDLGTPEGQAEYMEWAAEDARGSMGLIGLLLVIVALYGLAFYLIAIR